MHHAFPNAVGTLSQRGRFHGWEKVHDAAVQVCPCCHVKRGCCSSGLALFASRSKHLVGQVLARGLWKPNGDEETEMQKNQRKRSLILKDRVGA